MFDIKKLIAGAVSGFLSAVVVDVMAWSKGSGPFDWSIAIKRWIAGAVSGAGAAVGMGGM